LLPPDAVTRRLLLLPDTSAADFRRCRFSSHAHDISFSCYAADFHFRHVDDTLSFADAATTLAVFRFIVYAVFFR